MKIRYKVAKTKDFTVIEFDIPCATFQLPPDVLRDITPPKVNTDKGVIIDGMMPSWFRCFLVNYYSNKAKWVGSVDPWYDGRKAIVIRSNDPNRRPGDVIEGINEIWRKVMELEVFQDQIEYLEYLIDE